MYSLYLVNIETLSSSCNVPILYSNLLLSKNIALDILATDGFLSPASCQCSIAMSYSSSFLILWEVTFTDKTSKGSTLSIITGLSFSIEGSSSKGNLANHISHIFIYFDNSLYNSSQEFSSRHSSSFLIEGFTGVVDLIFAILFFTKFFIITSRLLTSFITQKLLSDFVIIVYAQITQKSHYIRLNQFCQ